ncbi:MAG TPA: hypothetical protein VLA17_09775 [Candidatus Limnocylindria bacterium]|nr:hypothetical protein [Candidatus Limnocylindria bacterium]
MQAGGRRVAAELGAGVGALVRAGCGASLGAIGFEQGVNADYTGGDRNCAYLAEKCTSVWLLGLIVQG